MRARRPRPPRDPRGRDIPPRDDLEKALKKACQALLDAGYDSRSVQASCAHALDEIRIDSWAEEQRDVRELARSEWQEALGTAGGGYVPPESLLVLAARWDPADPDWRELREPRAPGDRADDVALYPHWLPPLGPEDRSFYVAPGPLEVLRRLYPGVPEEDWSLLRVMTSIELERIEHQVLEAESA